jgi:tetraacyldisaccharide-1-P 4'-kinase
MIKKNDQNLHWQHIVRHILEQPFTKRFSTEYFWWNTLHWVFFPALLVVSIFWGLYSHLKRNFYLVKDSALNLQRSKKASQFIKTDSVFSLPIVRISVGNFVVGGSGKSPFVRHLLNIYLKKENIFCVLLSRGVGELNDNLTDENKEHLELLKLSVGKTAEKNLLILQHKNRGEEFEKLVPKIIEKALENKCYKIVAIADDALQHLQWKRDINICLWPKNIIRNSPWFCLPLGIFREGFFFQKNSLLKIAHNHVVWEEESQKCLQTYGVKQSNIFKLKGETSWYEINSENKIAFFDKQLVIKELLKLKDSLDKLLFITGIANPERVLHQVSHILKEYCPKNSTDFYLFPDHGKLNESFLSKNFNHKIVFTTCKDFFRWEHFFREKNWKCFLLSVTILCSKPEDFDIESLQAP